MRRVLFICLLALTACGGSSPAGPSTPTLPQVAGTYTNGTALWQYTLTRLSDNATVRLSCGGSMTLTQAGSSLTGSFLQRDGDCADAPGSGSVVNGTLASDGGTAFQLQVSGADPNFITAVFGCVFVSGSSGMNGAITGRTLDASATLVMQCPLPDGRVSIVTRLVGNR